MKTPANSNNNRIISLECKGLSEESIKPPATSDDILACSRDDLSDTEIWLKLNGGCLKQEKRTFYHKSIVHLYIVYEINLWSCNLGAKFKFGNSLFRAVKFTKTADHDKYCHSEYNIEFDSGSAFSLKMLMDFIKM